MKKSADRRKAENHSNKNPKPFIGRLKGQVTIVGDLVEPAIPPEDWDTDKFLRVFAPPRVKKR
jgi:hypothetical protein